MATITPTVSNYLGVGDGSLVLFTWVLTTADDNGAPLSAPDYADMTWVVGRFTDTFGGATCAIQGTNVLAPVAGDFVTLNDAAGGGAATGTAIKSITIIQNPLWVRPALTVVGVGATITVMLLARRATGMRQ